MTPDETITTIRLQGLEDWLNNRDFWHFAATHVSNWVWSNSDHDGAGEVLLDFTDLSTVIGLRRKTAALGLAQDLSEWAPLPKGYSWSARSTPIGPTGTPNSPRVDSRNFDVWIGKLNVITGVNDDVGARVSLHLLYLEQDVIINGVCTAQNHELRTLHINGNPCRGYEL